MREKRSVGEIVRIPDRPAGDETQSLVIGGGVVTAWKRLDGDGDGWVVPATMVTGVGES